MIRIFVGKRFSHSLQHLDAASRERLSEILAEVSQHFGNPHRHAGLGLRKLSPGLWECRLDIRSRVVFMKEKDRLIAYDVMSHDEIRAWLKNVK